MEHHRTPWETARRWLKGLESALPTGDALLIAEASHGVVHNSVVALRNFKSQGRGKIKHEEVGLWARRLGLPGDLAAQIQLIEGLHPRTEYGPALVPEGQAEAFAAAARELAGLVEGLIEGRKERKQR